MAFRTKYGRELALENQPNDQTLALVVKTHARRAADFISLANVYPVTDTQNTGGGPVRLKYTPLFDRPPSI